MIPSTGNHDLQSKITNAQKLFGPLKRLYERIPATQCKRRADCCKFMPEVSPVEFVHMAASLGKLARDVQREVIEDVVRYFFLNAARIGHCPFFWQGGCRIYEDRPFTCRAYGLWSKAHYKTLVAKNKKAKEPVRAAWESIGVSLPDDIIAYEPSHCDHVTITSGGAISDADLDLVQSDIYGLDGHLGQDARRFRQVFFSDPSFFLTSMLLGYQQCLVEKVAVVKEYLIKKQSARLKQLMDTLTSRKFYNLLKL